MRRLPGPADRPLCEGVKTPEAPVGLFRGWQRTQTQSSVRTLRSLRQQMDVWFCLMQELSEQESSAERHCCVEADPDQTNCAPSGARLGSLCFSLDFDLHRGGRSGHTTMVLLPGGGSSRSKCENQSRRRRMLGYLCGKALNAQCRIVSLPLFGWVMTPTGSTVVHRGDVTVGVWQLIPRQFR